ncbi:MAG: TonB-dependent receptor [Candidatus Brocadia sp. AMX2]|uniref:TonB-dependent receptor protein n=1 Tax=Candidatus Brocadia sinica JPN1 TaxID=1197129 RepID=A0ABQ0JWM8_9BACT|nr:MULTISPECIES: TonB-dependent receptor [Brocadia]KXK29545.1 MAG: TonB-dependent receptor [Candidatus Brocadia sinica]MBC6933533.1 TonB-dependent receptor [Candidatus Brocadia sp.]MBL1170398.1 TonB-dependent receptor [Candidatus Brocadia sp. AMX1]NOG41031.1 TonB-dependent receptor [Planctomycetota bacterium]KAA0242778.1 MAG: TonB-dependent receptor [Candidatus Brocadia sp. AMX2]
MAKRIIRGKFLFPVFLSLSILFIDIAFHSSEIHAEDTETTPPIATTFRSKEKHTRDMKVALEEEISTEAIWFGFDEEVAIATRHETPVGKAPSIVTVITAEEIKNLGYRTFVELLRVAPGFEILKSGDFGGVFPTVRGLTGSEHVRIMINGHFVNSPFGGAAFILFDDFPVENIKKIEIIRGPGSAVYGENAFSATINIITKDAKDVDGVRVSSGYGSFDTYEENIVFGRTYGKVNISGMAHYRQTTGFDGIVEEDSLSPAPFSQAPGKIQDGRQEYDLNLRVTYKDIYVEGLYINKNQGPFIGPQFALNDETDLESNYVFVETGYKKTFHEKFTLKPRVYYDQFDNNYYVESLPEGATVPLGDVNGDGIPDFVTYPDGLIGNGIATQKIVGTEIPFDYELFDGNVLTWGFEYRLINQTNVHFSSNFDTVTLAPKDFSESPDFIKETTRRIWAVYMQDTWDITDTLNLTLGVRHDQYSDFGGQTSPRAGLAWAFMKDAALKLLYGEAFRAPNFVELFTDNNPAIQGNGDLDPEKIKTYEIGLSYQFNKHVTSSMNYFYNDIEDLIVLRDMESNQNIRQYENFGNARVQGIEAETKVNIIKDNYVFMNYSFQHSEDNDGNDLPFVAKHKGNFGVNVHYWKYINTNLSTFVSGRRSREGDDPRSDLPAYALLNLSVIGKGFFKTMEVQGTVFNLLDKDYSDPGPISIPDDFPRPERTFFVGLSYQF